MMASDDSLAPRAVAANVAMMVVSSLAIAGRVTVSAVMMRSFWIDDAMSILGWVPIFTRADIWSSRALGVFFGKLAAEETAACE
ncbi:hypothetical protein MAPG_00735 [Magnaporthiopsis poae ATCC 64411]|uniref:Uncharacterized protein n=1 Tax=Magnaporthiopsis poae (strain ATCC 64411 / 73-15) TaxID=644358 RepID=A0A0C4DLT9_MAGP6|nr:hypothetical protein MAPG_00735 [Magnaporthiopsis poae ATCC 64411]